MKRYFVSLFLICIAFLTAACSGGGGGGSPQAPPPVHGGVGFEISGIVTEENDSKTYAGKPVAGVTIHVEPGGIVVTTGPDGSWVRSVPNGSYTVSAVHGTRALTPASIPVVVNSIPISGLNFVERIPSVTGREVAYIGTGETGNMALKRVTPVGLCPLYRSFHLSI